MKLKHIETATRTVLRIVKRVVRDTLEIAKLAVEGMFNIVLTVSTIVIIVHDDIGLLMPDDAGWPELGSSCVSVPDDSEPGQQ